MTSSGSHRDFISNIIPKSAAKVKPFCRLFQYLNRPAVFWGLRPIIIEPASVNMFLDKAPAEFTEDERNEAADRTLGISPYRT